MKRIVFAAAAVFTVVLASCAMASPYIGTGQYFVEPDGWSVGDAGSTYQAWDDFAGAAGNSPDAGYSTNPALGTAPTASAVAPGFVTSTSNFYSFSGDYGVEVGVANHASGASDGTHIIVQTASTTNGGISVYPGSLEIVDAGGAATVGGNNASALVNGSVLASGLVNSTFGVTNMELLIWEFFLPNYTGGFAVQWDAIAHSSFDQVRVDSLVTPTAMAPTSFGYQTIPEPGSVALSVSGFAALAWLRRRCA